MRMYVVCPLIYNIFDELKKKINIFILTFLSKQILILLTIHFSFLSANSNCSGFTLLSVSVSYIADLEIYLPWSIAILPSRRTFLSF